MILWDSLAAALKALPLNKWAGVDETVVKRFASEADREAWTPFINTDTGDLLLFVFLLAGIIGGFFMGYYYCKLFSAKS
jgi:hypothetical protein